MRADVNVCCPRSVSFLILTGYKYTSFNFYSERWTKQKLPSASAAPSTLILFRRRQSDNMKPTWHPLLDRRLYLTHSKDKKLEFFAACNHTDATLCWNLPQVLNWVMIWGLWLPKILIIFIHIKPVSDSLLCNGCFSIPLFVFFSLICLILRSVRKKHFPWMLWFGFMTCTYC